MSVWKPTPNEIPDGVVVQHTLYGEPQSQYLQAHTAPVGTEQLGVQSVDFSHIPYEGSEGAEQPTRRKSRS